MNKFYCPNFRKIARRHVSKKTSEENLVFIASNAIIPFNRLYYPKKETFFGDQCLCDFDKSFIFMVGRYLLIGNDVKMKNVLKKKK